jgi:hypothetical protein
MQLRKINALAYPNRKMDLETFPEMNNYLFKAPQQDKFGDDGANASQYRSYYFLTKYVGQQADALIAQMEEESKTLKIKITNTAALSTLEGQK